MTDALLTTEDQKEALSRAYVQAVAAAAGYTTSECNYDRDGVDLRICAGGEMHPSIDLQLKATINLRFSADGYRRFELKVHNYNLLRIRAQTPRLLVVFDLPKQEEQWITITRDNLIMRWCVLDEREWSRGDWQSGFGHGPDSGG